MSILIGSLEFEGPYVDFDSLSDNAGIFAVICQTDEEYELIELGEAELVREHLHSHPERGTWRELSLDVSVAVHYTPDLSRDERLEIKDLLDREFEFEVAACA